MTTFVGVAGIDCDGNGEADTCEILDGSIEDDNKNGIPDECEAAGDLNGDGEIGIEDFLALLAAWGPCPDCDHCLGDLNSDCSVGIIDFLLLLGNWG